jgi:ABC-type lipoprotein release transport system permease subunit
VAAQVASLAPVAAATPRLMANGIVSYDDQSLGARVMGVDPTSEANAPFRNGLQSGEFLKADDRQGVVIGLPLAKKIGLKVGDPINLLINTSNGDVDQQTFNVRGIYSTGTPTYDQSTILMPIEKAQAITQTANHASIIFVLLKDRAQTQAVVTALKSSLYKVLTFEQMNQILVETEKFANFYIYILFFIVLGITATVIINTFIMSVYERTREIGILAALGMRSGRIMAMFFAESSLLALGGIFMGLILGALMVMYATQVGFYIGNIGATGMLIGERIYAQFSLNDAIALTIIAFIVTLLAALYPAVLAARMEPVDALRGEK